MPTPQIIAVGNGLRKRMGEIPSAGIHNCRPIRKNGKERPDLGWSQHAYGNAEDLKINGYAKQKPYVDMLKKMKGEGYPVGTIIWAGTRPSDHSDHIHVEGSPKGTGTPECAGGERNYSLPEDVPREPSTSFLTNPNQWIADQVAIHFGTDPLTGQMGIGGRVVFGLVAIIAAVVTVVVLIGAWKVSDVVGVAKEIAT